MSLDGEWRFTVQAGDAGVRQATARFQTNGEVVTGRFEGGTTGNAEVEEGKITGGEVTFVVRGVTTQVFCGVVDGDSFVGTIDVDPVGEFEFSAVRV